MRRWWPAIVTVAIASSAVSANTAGWSPGPASWAGDLTPLTAADWSYDRAAHLLERAGFGGTPEDIQKLADMTPEQAVRQLVYYDALSNDHLLPFEHSGLWDETLMHFPPSRPAATELAMKRGAGMGVPGQTRVCQSPHAAGVRPFLLLAARNAAGNPPGRVLVGRAHAR